MNGESGATARQRPHYTVTVEVRDEAGNGEHEDLPGSCGCGRSGNSMA